MSKEEPINVTPPPHLSDLPIEQPISTESHITYMSYEDYMKELATMNKTDQSIMNFFKSFSKSDIEEEKKNE